MKIVTITAGHSNSDPGAVNESDRESEIAQDMRNIVMFYLKSKGVAIRTDGEGKGNLPLSEAVKLINGSKIAVEFHCNAATSKAAKGVEALSQPKDKVISQKLCAAVSSVMGNPLRGDKGWKPENSGQHSRLAYVSNGGIILELFFISNDAELSIWKQKKWLVGKAVAEVLMEHVKMKIETVAVNALDAAKTGYEIYLATSKAMDSIEEKAGLSGRSKLDWVLAFIKGSIDEVANNWSYWSTLLIKFISSIKTIYNIVK